jgi:excisionase family DNA binding protein|nr:MAG TPA: helix-turn-helix domain protein [Caudoviricetes sp.]
MGLMMIKPMPRKKVSVEPVEKIWLSTKEFAKYIGMSTGYIHDLRKSGQIHHYMIGNTAFFKKSDVDELIEGHKVC